VELNEVKAKITVFPACERMTRLRTDPGLDQSSIPPHQGINRGIDLLEQWSIGIPHLWGRFSPTDGEYVQSIDFPRCAGMMNSGCAVFSKEVK
jgi:hypothetical protein